MQFPITMEFKLLALTPQVSVTDANGQLVCFVKQKMFKLKEKIDIFQDVEKQTALFSISADKVLDYSARYRFTDPLGQEIGSTKRHGRKSIWKARYDIYQGEQVEATIKEDNAWVKVGDGLFSEIPFVGMLSGYVFNPTYTVADPNGTVLAKIKKRPGFTSRTFEIDKISEMSEASETRIVLAILMMTLRERRRG